MIGLVPKSDLRASLEKATRAYEAQLTTDDEALAYLAERKIGNAVRGYFRLGVVRTPMPGDESYQNRLSIPYVTPSGVVSMRFKSITGHGAKMLVHEGDEARLYNTRALLGARDIYITEGEPDTWSAWDAEIRAVGIPGAEIWQKNARTWRRIFANRRVHVLADNDDEHTDPKGNTRRPGWEMAQDIYKSLGGCGIILMPEGHDVSSYRKEVGRDELKAWIAARSS